MIPETQLESYQDQHPGFLEKREIVLAAVRRYVRGLALFELVEILGWPINSISGRVTELHDCGRLVDSGERRLNPKTGRKAVVWKDGERAPIHFDATGQGSFV